MGAPEPGQGAGDGDAPEQHRGGARSGGPGSHAGSDDPGSEGVDYAWLADQLAQLGMRLGDARVEDEIEDDVEEWHDPTGGALLQILGACEAGEDGELPGLLEEMADGGHSIDTPGPDGDTALHIACLYGSERCAELLLAAGARVDALNPEDGTSPFHDAAAGGFTPILRRLADAARRQLAWTGGGGGTAAAGGQAQASAQGSVGKDGATAAAPAPLAALVNTCDSDGESALRYAARGGHAEAVELLLGLGADPHAAAHDGRLPIDEAEEEAVVALLRAAMGTGSSGGGGGSGGSGRAMEELQS